MNDMTIRRALLVVWLFIWWTYLASDESAVKGLLTLIGGAFVVVSIFTQEHP